MKERQRMDSIKQTRQWTIQQPLETLEVARQTINVRYELQSSFSEWLIRTSRAQRVGADQFPKL
jgi:hypothetical protein